MSINNNLLGITSTDLYISSATSAITVMYFCNTNTVGETITLHAVPSGDTVTTQNQIYKDINIPAGDTYIVESERLVLDAGDKIVGIASTAAVIACTISSMGV